MNRTPTLLALPLLGALLVACGGTDLPADGAGAIGSASIAAAAPASWPVAPLLADDGSVMPTTPQAVPTDPGAHTRAGRYASPAQAEQLERTLATGLVRVTVRGSGAEAVEAGAGQVHSLLTTMNLPASAAVLIEGADPRAAAALVDRLAAQGVDNTWLVTQ
jgi:hypothetical protein